MTVVFRGSVSMVIHFDRSVSSQSEAERVAQVMTADPNRPDFVTYEPGWLGSLGWAVLRIVRTPPGCEAPEAHDSAADSGHSSGDATRAHIEALFLNARHDARWVHLLKRELDRFGLFEEYEDRFLDMFRPGGCRATGQQR